ncbi:MAG: hypothetical protein J0H84_04850 [Rhizobiales bacterium]|jgi:hypothetical protein|nr:hypothetical protein [Hyphomicrobiales bacterium]
MRVRIALAAATALTALGFAAPAMATTPAVTGTTGVNVQVNILPTVSIWAPTGTLTLNLDGSNAPNNDAAVASTISYINNVDANITASVSNIPAGTTAGGGIQFHIFGNTNNVSAALAAIAANGYTPVGAISFNATNQATPQTLVPSTGVNTSAVNQNVVYAAGLPGDLPAPTEANLVVTYTITSN